MPRAGRKQKYVVRLSAEERETLQPLLHKGRHPASQTLKARILLKADMSGADEAWDDERIVEALDTSPSTVCRTRQRLAGEGFEAVLRRKPRERPSIPRIFDGGAEARLIQLACSAPPEGLDRRRKRRNARAAGLVAQQASQALGQEAILPPPDRGLAGAGAPGEFHGPAAIGGQQHDLRPPDMLLRAVSIHDDAGQGQAVSFGDADFDGFAHPPDSHEQGARGILNRMQMSDYIH